MKTIFIAFLFTFLSACSNFSYSDYYQKEFYSVENAISESRYKTTNFNSYFYLKNFYDSKINHPVNGFKYKLNTSSSEVLYVSLCNESICKKINNWEYLSEIMIYNLDKSLNENDILAYYELYNPQLNSVFVGNTFISKKIANLKSKYIKNLIVLANQKNDITLLMTVGILNFEGLYTEKNVENSNYYYQKAYALGESKAASYISKNYYAIGDYKNSLFWSFRCDLECYETSKIIKYKPEDYKTYITPELFHIIKKQASNKNQNNVSL